MARPLYKSFLLWTRTLHIYLTMLVMILLVFFSFTGFVMNHPEWFNIDNAVIREGTATMPTELAAGAGADQKLKVVEYLRSHESARGEMTAYDDQEDSARVQFTGPGRKTEFTINKSDGAVQVHEETHNTLALVADLHKGTGSGGAWRRFIDATSILLMFASLSGMVLWISLPRRRTLGIVALVVCVALCLGCFFWLVP